MSGNDNAYFPNWDVVNYVLPGIIEAIFNVKITYSWAKQALSITLAFAEMEYFIPDEYRSTYRIVCDDFVLHRFASVDELNAVVSGVIARYANDNLTEIETIKRIRRTVLNLLNARMAVGGMSVQDTLKGWMELPPYRLKIPDTVRRRVFNKITLHRLRIDSGYDEVPFECGRVSFEIKDGRMTTTNEWWV